MTQIISTSQAPDAKPIGLSATLTTDWASLIEVPSYEVPQQSFGGGTDIVPGVGEIISPMLVCNRSVFLEYISVRIYRESSNTYFSVAQDIPIPVRDAFAIPLNGQFIFTGDVLEAKASSGNVLDITLSYTVGQAEQDDVI